MEEKQKNKYLSAIKLVFISAMFFVIGVYFGFENRPSVTKITNVLNTNTPEEAKAETIDFEPYWNAWKIINEKYPDEINKEEMIYGSIKGLASSLGDPYTEFFPPEENKAFGEEITGEFGGIGVEIDQKDGNLVVIAPLSGSPAEKSGILSGDKIIAIDGENTEGKTIDENIALIRGDVGSSVVLTIIHEGESVPKNISVERKIITVPTVETDNSNEGIFVINFYSFSLHADREFRNALQEFLNSGKNKLIIDLRGNPGGYLDHAIDTASWFLKPGVPVVIESAKNNEKTIFRSKGYNIFGDGYDIVILVDGGSASASEILAGALQEYGIAKLVGEQTYGKGSVQEVVNITEDTALKITVAKWLTPNGVSISENGLTPDYEVLLTKEDILNKNDRQMKEAIRIINEM